MKRLVTRSSVYHNLPDTSVRQNILVSNGHDSANSRTPKGC